MRKLFAAGLLGLAVLAWGVKGQAVILGTAHETGAGQAGPCSACHIPHGGGADRLWPTTTGTATYTGVVSGLCSSCHDSTGGYSGVMAAAFSDDYVYAATSHGTLMETINEPWSTDTAASGATLPYNTDPANFECTTCHDVHDDLVRPFLRDTLNQICARCHTNRHFVDGALSEGAAVTAGTWGGGAGAPNVALANPGSHPVGSDVTGDNWGGVSDITIPPTIMDIVISADAEGWVLGGHLTTAGTGGVTCVTCHAVHGLQADTDNTTVGNSPGTDASPSVNYLAVAQNSVSDPAWTDPGAGARSVANGDNSTNDGLCEACHGTTNVGGAAYGGTYAVNPGSAANFTHPVDDLAAQYDAGVTAFGANWPEGTAPGANVSPGPICESCHVPHPAAELADGRADVMTGGGVYILRDDYSTVCDVCHTGAIGDGHHPVGMTYDSTDVAYLINTTGAPGDTLTCSTCHTSQGAHNWPAAANGAPGVDNNWVPADNARDESAALADMFDPDMSKTCMDCHYGMDGDRASVSPTLGAANNLHGAGDPYDTETDFQVIDDSMGTHYIGLMTANTNWFGDGSTDANTNTWTANRVAWFTDNWGAVGNANGWSRWGGSSGQGNAVVVCESCHELEPDKNVDVAGTPRHLLLATYFEGTNGDEGGTVVGQDEFCEACHGVPNGTHPLTGYVVSRTSAALDAGATWLRAPVIGDATMDVANDYLSCDSCHQVHDANTNSFTFMLDAPVSIAAPAINPVVGPGTPDAASPAPTAAYPEADGTVNTYATPTLENRGGDFTGYCDQCHIYAY